MSIVNKYRIYCNTEATHVYEWAESEPTDCPNNVGHSIDSSKTTIVDTIGDEYPKTTDGKMRVAPDMFSTGDLFNATGCGDDVTVPTIHAGTFFGLQSDAIEDKTIEFQFCETVELVGGVMTYENASFGDWIQYDVYAPAADATSNPGAGEYGLSQGVYYPQQNGDYDLDLTSLTKVAPVPISTLDGYFDWDDSSQTLTPNLTGTGAYHILAVNQYLNQHISKIPMLGSHRDDLAPDAVRSEACLPHWKHKVTVHHTVASPTLSVVFRIELGRRNTISC
jgi:hypothetical protein